MKDTIPAPSEHEHKTVPYNEIPQWDTLPSEGDNEVSGVNVIPRDSEWSGFAADIAAILAEILAEEAAVERQEQ